MQSKHPSARYVALFLLFVWATGLLAQAGASDGLLASGWCSSVFFLLLSILMYLDNPNK